MHVQNNPALLHTRFRRRVLTGAVLSTIVSAGLSQGAVSIATGTFDIAVVGINGSFSSPNDSEFLVGPYVATFGTTATETNATIDGETATITSSESAANGITTDKVSLSVPQAFVPSGTTFKNGDVINEEDLEIGYSAGTKGLSFSVPITSTITAKGTSTYSYAGYGPYTSEVYPDPTFSLSADGTTLKADEYSSSGAFDTTSNNDSAFSFAFSYATPAVPEPATATIGIAMAGAALMRRRNRNKPSPIVALETGLIDDPAANGL